MQTLVGIKDGSITLAFRRWKRPTVKAGGTLLTPIGQLAVESVEVVRVSGIKKSEALAAGYESLAALKAELSKRTEGDIYRVRISLAGPDPRIALRNKAPGAAELDGILKRLERMDARSTSGPWTTRWLALIRERPGERAPNLAEDVGMERDEFKARVRRLKGLGLTESLKVGYRLSPRGKAVLTRLET